MTYGNRLLFLSIILSLLFIVACERKIKDFHLDLYDEYSIKAINNTISGGYNSGTITANIMAESSGTSMNLTGITFAQYSRYGILGWFFIPCIIGFVVMFICILAELNRCPFDLPEAESELICGYNTEYSGMRFALFYLREYALLFANALSIVH